MPKPTVVVLSGSGISAESGLQTFRDAGGLWENLNVFDLATPEGFERDPETVLRFYNDRRQQVRNAQPNVAHRALAELEQHCEVRIITQNVDDLHERAGSTRVLHLHGNILQACSSCNPDYVVDLDQRDIELGDVCDRGCQLRPNVVWFGEPVPAMVEAEEWTTRADHFLVVGTSLMVYPAAGLLETVAADVPITLIDPGDDLPLNRARHWQCSATEGVPRWVETLSF